ncbi:OmpW/AlkL family protein [Ferrigenium sp. UT5]|uniref:OmpW/AlkL family protein n=1 Tax=Ferrigenium sp. UT5 TaxID=3242105 RepID=UPI00354CBA2B
MRNKVLVAMLATAGLLSAPVVQAEEGVFMVRARALYVDFSNGQNNLPINVEADNRWIPEVDFSYFITPNIAAELVLTTPQSVDIKNDGTKLGSVRALPPSLLLQYHVTELGAFKPYVGLGLNYTIFSSRNVGTTARVDSSSLGLAAQVGADYMLDKNWGINADLKYIQMDTKVKAGGSSIGTLDLNPITVGAGVTYRF